MQQITCPNCGEPVSAENINIQEMVAVCKACNTIFRFDVPNADTAKAKRRKVKQPQHLTLEENDDILEMAFRTNFRLDRDETVVASGIIGLTFTMLSVVMAGELLADGRSLFLPFVMLTVAAVAFYRLGLHIFNKTHIEMNDESIRVTRQPLPNFLAQPIEINLSGIVAIRTEETEISIKEAYDTPRYRVWAETADGSKRTIVNDVTEDYAYFIAQRLDARLQIDSDALDVSRLEEHEQTSDNENLLHHLMHTNEETDRY